MIIGRNLVMLLMLATCISCNRTKDVSYDPGYGHFTNIVGRWTFSVPVQLMQSSDHSSICTIGTIELMHAKSIATLPKGTEIDILHLIRVDTSETSYVYVEGSIASGPYSGKVVSLTDSFFKPDNILTDALLHHDYGAKIKDWGVSPELLSRTPK